MKQVVSAQIVNTEVLFAHNSDAYWDEFDRRHGFRSEEEMDAELDALVPNWRRILGDDDENDDVFWGKLQ